MLPFRHLEKFLSIPKPLSFPFLAAHHTTRCAGKKTVPCTQGSQLLSFEHQAACSFFLSGFLAEQRPSTLNGSKKKNKKHCGETKHITGVGLLSREPPPRGHSGSWVQIRTRLPTQDPRNRAIGETASRVQRVPPKERLAQQGLQGFRLNR